MHHTCELDGFWSASTYQAVDLVPYSEAEPVHFEVRRLVDRRWENGGERIIYDDEPVAFRYDALPRFLDSKFLLRSRIDWVVQDEFRVIPEHPNLRVNCTHPGG